MIAKVTIELPFSLTIPFNEKIDIVSFNIENYKISFPPFLQGENANGFSDANEILINGQKTYNANILQIIFQKDNFDRLRNSQIDPPIALIEKVANDFLLRLRYAIGASDIKPLKRESTIFNLQYLNDDGTELEMNPLLIRGRTNKNARFKVYSLTNKIWKDIHSIKKSDIPKWKILLLDADFLLPEIGPSIVLTFTALEVFISTILDELAAHKKFDTDFWNWVNNRGFFLKEPSMDEQFDFLCKKLVGVSLKNNPQLWEAYKNLQTARNSFAHTGIAKIKDMEVDEHKARDFIIKANEIIGYLKANIPKEIIWVEFDYSDIKIEGRMKLN